MGYLKGISYICLWYASILAGYAGLFCPLLPLLVLSNRLYRTLIDFFYTFWQMYPTALLELVFGCRVLVSGDVINANENCLLVMNHRTRTDWNFLWPAAYQATSGLGRLRHPLKFVLKDEIRHIPGIGWVMQLACFLYIKRNWLLDKIKLTKMMDYFCNMNYKFSLLIFPEGTDLTPETKMNSDRYATRYNLPKYEHVLHPHTTGFAYLGRRLIEKQALDAIYDVTIIYCDNIPQSEKFIIRGDFPKEIKVHFHRYKFGSFPLSEEGLKGFLEKRWQEKERHIHDFYTNRHFLHGKRIMRTNRCELYFALIFWTLLPFVITYILIAHHFFRQIVLYHTLFLIAINCFTDGFQNFEIFLYNFKRKLFWC